MVKGKQELLTNLRVLTKMSEDKKVVRIITCINMAFSMCYIYTYNINLYKVTHIIYIYINIFIFIFFRNVKEKF